MNLLDELYNEIAILPGIGKRSARRLLFHFLSNKPEDFDRFVHILKTTREKVKPCKVCNNLSEEEICHICSSVRRNKNIICIVEKPQDVFAMEATQIYFGLYHVLGGVISPIKGVGPQQLKINELIERLKQNTYQEVILALNSTIESEATRLYLRDCLSPYVKISELARGMPAGGELEYVDRGTIQKALEERRIQ